MHNTNLARSLAGLVVVCLGSAAFGQPLADCTIRFDSSCPDVTPECGASFSGGSSCVVEGLGNCYHSGLFSYKVTPTAPVTITLSGDLTSLEVFFAHQGPASSGLMRFFDAVIGGSEVGTPLLTNGNCLMFMPPTQLVSFSLPVRRIEVTASGGTAWIDDFRVNPSPAFEDCNNNGTPDDDDIAGGASLDCNANGIPDDCEFPGCPGILPADMNCDGTRNGTDVQRFVDLLVAGGYTCQADMNQDGIVDPADMTPFVNALLGL